MTEHVEALSELASTLMSTGARQAGLWVSRAALHLDRGNVDECHERLTMAFDACPDRAWREVIQTIGESIDAG